MSGFPLIPHEVFGGWCIFYAHTTSPLASLSKAHSRDAPISCWVALDEAIVTKLPVCWCFSELLPALLTSQAELRTGVVWPMPRSTLTFPTDRWFTLACHRGKFIRLLNFHLFNVGKYIHVYQATVHLLILPRTHALHILQGLVTEEARQESDQWLHCHHISGHWTPSWQWKLDSFTNVNQAFSAGQVCREEAGTQ